MKNILISLLLFLAVRCSDSSSDTKSSTEKREPKKDTIQTVLKNPKKKKTVIPFHLDAGCHLITAPFIDSLIRAYSPNFRIIALNGFSADCGFSDSYSCNKNQGAAAVIGKFNNDTLNDLAILGSSDKINEVIVLLSDGNGFEVKSLLKGNFAYDGTWVIISHIPPETYQSHYEEQPLHLTNDALMVYYCGKAGEIYYFKNDQFHPYAIAD